MEKLSSLKDLRKEALALIKMGISVVPLRKTGEKIPAIHWKTFSQKPMTKGEVDYYFRETTGIFAITGKVSRLLLLDFDLDKALPHQDFFGDFMKAVPSDLKDKFLINSTRSGGKHIWIRTDFESKSSKIARRYLTVPELASKYEDSIETGLDPYLASMSLLKKPLECVIETRSRGSGGVLMHDSYTRVQGNRIPELSVDEVELLLEIAYSLDCGFVAKKTYVGNQKAYATISRFNDETEPTDVMQMLESTGIYTYAGEDSSGNIKMKRNGSANPHSAYIFRDTGRFYTFSIDTLFTEDKQSFSPFEVYCAVNNLSEYEGIESIIKKEHI